MKPKLLPYRVGSRLTDILQDDWSRGFLPQQTYEEANQMGFEIDVTDVQRLWHFMDRDFEFSMMQEHYHE